MPSGGPWLLDDWHEQSSRSGGMTKADAGEEAWRRMAAEYPPLPHICESVAEALPTPPPAANELFDVDALLADRLPPNLTRDVLWAYSAGRPQRQAARRPDRRGLVVLIWGAAVSQPLFRDAAAQSDVEQAARG